MGLDFVVSISSLVGAVALGLSLAVHNNKRLKETHDYRMQIYRRNKKLKNEYLRRRLGVPRQENAEGKPSEAVVAGPNVANDLESNQIL